MHTSPKPIAHRPPPHRCVRTQSAILRHKNPGRPRNSKQINNVRVRDKHTELFDFASQPPRVPAPVPRALLPPRASGKIKITARTKTKTMKFGVIVFPGSNCDHDAFYAVANNLGQPAEFIWHDSSSLGDVDAVILPGGFSYGDYLRCGAIAKFSPVMAAVRKFAADGGLVLGVCNGFQILVEAGL